MRLLKECYLRDVQVGEKFLVDGAWYMVRTRDIGAPAHDTRVTVQLKTEFYQTDDEARSGMVWLHHGDTVMYRADLVVIVEV